MTVLPTVPPYVVARQIVHTVQQEHHVQTVHSVTATRPVMVLVPVSQEHQWSVMMASAVLMIPATK
jgi:hypothetical protein